MVVINEGVYDICLSSDPCAWKDAKITAEIMGFPKSVSFREELDWILFCSIEYGGGYHYPTYADFYYNMRKKR